MPERFRKFRSSILCPSARTAFLREDGSTENKNKLTLLMEKFFQYHKIYELSGYPLYSKSHISSTYFWFASHYIFKGNVQKMLYFKDFIIIITNICRSAEVVAVPCGIVHKLYEMYRSLQCWRSAIIFLFLINLSKISTI